MNPAAPSALTTNLFVGLCIFMITLHAYGESWSRIGRDPREGIWRRAFLKSLALSGYFAIPMVLASSGFLDHWTTPPPALILIGVLTIATMVLAFSAYGANFADRIPLVWLVGFQVFRVPVELILHRLYEEGVIPVQMTYTGRNFDIVSGLTAALVAIVIATGRRPRWLLWSWNVLGLILLGNIVVIAILSTPTPLRVFMNDPPNRLIGTNPFIWLPTVLVQAALFGHLVVFRALMRRPA